MIEMEPKTSQEDDKDEYELKEELIPELNVEEEEELDCGLGL